MFFFGERILLSNHPDLEFDHVVYVGMIDEEEWIGNGEIVVVHGEGGIIMHYVVCLLKTHVWVPSIGKE